MKEAIEYMNAKQNRLWGDHGVQDQADEIGFGGKKSRARSSRSS